VTGYEVSGELAPSAAFTESGIDHIRLSYHYRDVDDIDGYGSLLHEDVEVRQPDMPLGRGRAEVMRLESERVGSGRSHRLEMIIADGHNVAVTGRLVPPLQSRQKSGDTEFTDVFVLSDDGMLLMIRRFYFATPGI
jgi:ketosteroid isomerase-like protein